METGMSALAARLHLKHLRLIAAIAEQGQLSVAADLLGMTQPAASRTLAEAEDRVGAALFERHPKGMLVTDIGESLARRARNILDELNDASAEVDRLRSGLGGVVRIGAVTGAAVGYVAPAIRHLRRSAPEVELHVEVSTSDTLMAGLLSLRHDMILSRVPVGMSPGALTLRRARGEQVSIVANIAHPGFARPPGLADLADNDWVIQGPGSPIRRAMEEAFLARGAPLPRNVINTSSLLMVLALLQGPEAVTPVSQEVAALLTAGHASLAVLPLQDRITVEPYSLITLRDRRLSPAAARCRDLLADLVAAG
ncbi:LysR family transcriptional regulator [Cereibacter changlensis JA139]|uniref:LysR family transcriptional regulator n=3 Tax=Cereibacter changlensis TaxID=402884 RepID=A0A2T4JVD0_9RHOB|nr:LysR family transcriptional regulator [Cereibacter changlensis JA139]PZX51624.1 DNA-binding transcriptional LysR family regulator [Cereibacter changlensis]